MKRILAALLSVIMLLSAVSAGAVSLDFLKQPVRNYTADAELSMSFTTAKELVSALEELGINLSESDANEMIDFVPFLESLLNIRGVANVKADVSEDYNKFKLSMTADYDYGVELNQSLAISADIKQEMWMELDLSDVANPKYFIVMMSPLSTKYTYIDFFEGMAEEEKLMIVAILKSLLNKEFIDAVNSEMIAIYEEYAIESKDGKQITISIDNDGFLKMFDKIFELLLDRLAAIIPGFAESMGEIQLPKLQNTGIKLLGEKGMEIELSDDGTVSMMCDIYINVNEIYSTLAGEELPIENELVIGFTILEKDKIYDVGKTQVVMPTLTEENSINLNDMLYGADEDVYYDDDMHYEEYEPVYPNSYVDVYTDYIPQVDGKLYVPLRQVLVGAYDENINITYDKGNITVTSDYFTDMDKLSLVVGSTKANVDGFDFEVGEIVLENGITYVTTDFFEIVFGWTLDWAVYDILYDEYNIGFYTYTFEEYYEEA